MSEIKCCTVSCDKVLDQSYWDSQYQSNQLGWDLGKVSPPIKSYFDAIDDKNAAILIPGSGNSYEAEYLSRQGFTNITVIDIAPTLVEKLKQKFADKNITVLLGDFFEHQGEYDYIIEQTFFCALPPTMRQKYIDKMHRLLTPHGKLVGLLFNREFESGPPFGGSLAEYDMLFRKAFIFNTITVAGNSVSERANSELFIEFQKNSQHNVRLYQFTGITCGGCMESVTDTISRLPEVLNVSMNTDFSELLIVSRDEIALEELQKVIAYDTKYKIVR